jgi:hypothetical protein
VKDEGRMIVNFLQFINPKTRMIMSEYETNYYLDEVVNRDENELDEMMTDISNGVNMNRRDNWYTSIVFEGKSL